MESLFSEGFSVSLEDFSISSEVIENIQNRIQDISPLLYQLWLTYNELVELQLENHLRLLRMPVANFILKSMAMGNIIDSTNWVFGDMTSLFQNKYPFCTDFPSEEFGLVRVPLFSNTIDFVP